MAFLPRIFAMFSLAFALSHSAPAAVLFQTGFEPSAYHVGALSGQNGWSSGIGNVETGTVLTGTQAVGFNAAGQIGQSDSFLSTPFGPGFHDIEVTIDFLVTLNDATTFWNPIALLGSGGFIGQIEVNSNNAIFGTSGGPSTTISIGQWNRYTLDLNFDTDTVTALLNGTAFGSGAFSPSNTALSLVALGINTASGTGTSQGFFDNLAISTVPEPSMLALLAIGLLGASGAHRRKERAAP